MEETAYNYNKCTINMLPIFEKHAIHLWIIHQHIFLPTPTENQPASIDKVNYLTATCDNW